MMEYTKLLELAIKTALEAGKETIKYYQNTNEVIVKDDNSPLTLADLESNKVINERLTSDSIQILSEENKIVPFGERKKWKRFWLIDPLDGTKEFINKRSEYTVNIALIEAGIPVLGVVYAPVLELIYFGMKDFGSFKLKVHNEYTLSDIFNKAEILKPGKLANNIRIVASRSHLSTETQDFIDNLEKYKPLGEIKSIGSSLKLCLVAEGQADIYPRLGPTMEWDTAASHAVATYAGVSIIDLNTKKQLTYNKEDLLNPYFIVFNPELDDTLSLIFKPDM